MKGNEWWIKYAGLELLGVATISLAGFAMSPVSFRSETVQVQPLSQQAEQNTRFRTIHIGGRDVQAMIADTPALREKGLSGRAGLAPDEGILFVFPADGQYGFWMKDMRFPIDILWLSGRGEILDMRKSVSPSTYPAVFTPAASARYVLELPAGFSEAYTVKIGDEVKL